MYVIRKILGICEKCAQEVYICNMCEVCAHSSRHVQNVQFAHIKKSTAPAAGHPSKYWADPVLFNISDQMRTGRVSYRIFSLGGGEMLCVG